MSSDADKVAAAASNSLAGVRLRAYDYQSSAWLWRLRLHVFHRGDPGDALHDHPWWYVTVPLVSYVEQVLGRGVLYYRVVPALWPSFRPASHTHKVLGRWGGGVVAGVPTVQPGAVITLALRGRNKLAWNYVQFRSGKEYRFPWRRYLAVAEKHPRGQS